MGIVHYTADGRLKMCRINSDGTNAGGAKYYIGGADINNPNPVPISQEDIISKYNAATQVEQSFNAYNFNRGSGFVLNDSMASTANFNWSNKNFLFGTSNSIPNDSLYSLGKADNDGSIEFKITSTSECIIGISNNNIVSSHSVQDIIDNNYYEVFGF